nr:molybdenum ABC transporter permease [Mucilaginibacter sp. L294]
METLHHLSSVQVTGIVILFIGIALRYWVNRRRFYRTNSTGVQLFGSYSKKVAFTIFEKLIKLLGLIMVIFGLLITLMEWSNQTHDRNVAQRSHHNRTIR